MSKCLVAVIVLLPLGCLAAADECSLRIGQDVRCEYQRNPLGMDVARPRLSWVISSLERGQRQTAYRVLVASTAERLQQDQGDLWDSGRVASDQSVQVVYGGKPLNSRDRCFWKVRVWDKDGRPSSWSCPKHWTMGLLEAADWQARWIHFQPSPAAVTSKPAPATAVSPWFRKTFTLEAKPDRALIYVNAVGYFELYVNGQKVGGDVLSPPVCDFRARSFYVTYDIAKLLRKGTNCVAVWMGQGWHAPERPGVQIAGPMLRVQCEIVAGGKTTQVLTDETWKCAPSPYATLGKWWWNLFGGERYDARLEKSGWNTAELDDRDWAKAAIAPPPVSRAEAALCPLNCVGQKIACVAVTDLGKGLYELDFGTNLTGWLRLRMPRLPAGQRVVIHYADKRYRTAAPETTPAGKIAVSMSDETFQAAEKLRYQTFNQADEFISAGRPGEEFCSKFNYHGFRYAIIEGLPARPAPGDAEALLIETNLEPVGSFDCSNDLLNRIHCLNLWTVRCLNLGGYLVDCPHRERLGYGDGQVSAEGCLMNWWMPGFYQKWLRDWRDGQNPQTGEMPYVAPDDKTGGGPAWGGGMAAVAWRTYLFYGDRRILEDSCDSLRRYVDYLEGRATSGIIRYYRGQWYFIGDWVAPGRGMDTENWPSARAAELFNNCYRVYLWQLLEQTNTALGRADEARRCRARLDAIRPLIHAEFYDRTKRMYQPEEQAYQVMPLVTAVAPESERAAVARALEDLIRVRRKGHLDTGMLGTYFLIQHLQATGRSDLVFTILTQKTYPGWGYMLDQGATTIWEQWNGFWSQIHSCFTSPGGWFYQGLAGIQPDPAAPGFKRFIIRPAVVGDVTWVKASFRSIHGTIASNWAKKDGEFTLEVTVPVNTTATVYMPATYAAAVTESGKPATTAEGVKLLRMENGRAVFAVESGKYLFVAKEKKGK